MPVNTPCQKYTDNLKRWQTVWDCVEGDDAIKTKGETYLPRMSGYSEIVYRPALPEVGTAMPWDKSATDPIRWAAKMKDVPRDAVNIFADEVFNRIVMRTPEDTGVSRQNWLVTLNGETSEFDPSKRKGGSVLTDGAGIIEGAKGDDKIFIQNNMPYIRKLEYGGYPENPKRGGMTKKEEPKTVDGFSRQSQHGMVGLVLSKADQLWERAVKTAKGE